MRIEYIPLDQIHEYDFNPRDNAAAIEAVASSIRQYGFLVPCVIDASNVLVTGHTRTAAARRIGMTEVPCLRANHLSEDQIRAFRLVDNKSSELSTWDPDLLAREISALLPTGIDFTQFGWKREEIDCLSAVVQDDCLEMQVTPDEETQAATAMRRAPTTTRIVIGDFVFFVPAATYRAWADGIRNVAQFSEDNIVLELKRRLGIPLV